MCVDKNVLERCTFAQALKVARLERFSEKSASNAQTKPFW
jgi:hypothetical protein